MSHFSVLVVAQDEEDLEKKLLPYHEYECTGYKEYVEWVPLDMVQAEEKFNEVNNRNKESNPEFVYESLETFIRDYYGYEKNQYGEWGRWTNPNAKWDWWVIGGRWSGLLLNKTGQEVDCLHLSDLDTEGMKNKNMEIARKRYQAWQNRPNREKNEKIYRNYIFDNHLIFLDQDEINELDTLSEEEYVEKNGNLTALTYALVDQEGMWHARGEMGWFGIDSDHNEDYDGHFWGYLNKLQPNTHIYVVDCHI